MVKETYPRKNVLRKEYGVNTVNCNRVSRNKVFLKIGWTHITSKLCSTHIGKINEFNKYCQHTKQINKLWPENS